MLILHDPFSLIQLTKRGYENILLLGDEDLAAQAVQAFAILGVFHKVDHWPDSPLNNKWWDSAHAFDQEGGVGVHCREGASSTLIPTAVGAGIESSDGHQGAQKYSPRFWFHVQNLLRYEVVIRNRITGLRGRAPRSH